MGVRGNTCGNPSLAGQTLFFSFLFIGGRGRTKNNSLVKLACLVRVALSAIFCSPAGCGLFVIVRALLSRARRASYGCSYSRSQIFSACGCFAQPPFSFPVQEILGQCYTNLACEFDQTIIFRPTMPPIKKNKVWLARLWES